MMLSPLMTRAGVVISTVWIVVGGYYIYLQNSYQDHWDVVRGICSLGNEDNCAEITAESMKFFSPEWPLIIFYITIGLAAIWIALIAISWVQRAKDTA